MALSQIETASLSSALVAPTATALTTASGSAPSYSARAWVNFNGTGTVAIRASGNVSSITDNGLGQYRVNFANSFSDASFALTFTVKGIPATSAGLGSENHDGSRAASFVDVLAVRRDTGAGYDSDQCNVAIFR